MFLSFSRVFLLNAPNSFCRLFNATTHCRSFKRSKSEKNR